MIGWAGRLTAIKRPLDLIRRCARSRTRRRRPARARRGRRGPAGRRGARRGARRSPTAAASSAIQKSIRPWYASFDVLLLTSANEGTPVVAIEALAAGRPVVATRAGGTGTVVDDGESGFLAPVGDTAALAARLASWPAIPSCARGWASAGPRMRARFSVGRMADEVEAIYRRLLGVKVLHLHKVTGRQRLGGAPARAAPGAARARRRRALARARRARRRMRRASTRRSTSSASPAARSLRARRLARGWRATSSARCAPSSPTSSTRTWCTRTSTARSRRACSRMPFVSTRHNDDRYLLGPFRYVDRAFMRPCAAAHRDLGRGARSSSSGPGHDRRSW